MHTPCVRGTIIFQIRKCAPQMVANRKAKRKLEAHRKAQELAVGPPGSAQYLGSNEYDLNTPIMSLNGINPTNLSGVLNRSNTLPPKAAALRQLHTKSVHINGESSDSASIYENIERRRHLARTESLNRTYLSRRNSELQNYLMINTRLPCLVELAQGKSLRLLI